MCLKETNKKNPYVTGYTSKQLIKNRYSYI